jgi:tetratricopeptide (TPR) repeat protein
VHFPSRIDTDLTTSRFEIRRLLGWGGMGVVYEAFDRQRRTRVALKTLLRLDAAGRLRFKNEFRSLVDLSHPNLVRLGELLEENGQLFFTMELVQGAQFTDYVRGTSAREPGAEASTRKDELDTVVRPSQRAAHDSARPGALGGAFDEARLRAALAQLAHGLAALHASGRVHRDIKPSNVLVTEEGRLVILDFGLVTETWADEEEHVVGTAHFMAPEQAVGRSVGPAADWYAVGVMLYLALTGVLPFDVASDAVASLKQRATPLPPSAVTAGVPADLDALAMALLRIEPEERAGHEEILRVLGETPAPVPFAQPGAAVEFVGRSRELAALTRVFEEALRGEARALVVEGESGVGKSMLGRELMRRLPPEVLVLTARCYERESVPYKAVDGVVDRLAPYLSKLPPEEVRALLPADMGLATSVFPVLGIAEPVKKISRPPPPLPKPASLGDKDLVLDLLSDRGHAPDEGAPPGERATADQEGEPRREAQATDEGPPRSAQGASQAMEPAELRARVFAAMRELFANIAAKRPVVLAIDDLQWADPDSISLLSEILRPETEAEREARPAPSPILLFACVRTETEADRRPQIALALPPRLVRTVQLSRMPPDEAQDLVGSLLRSLGGEAAEGGLDVAQVITEGSGHPLFLDALVRHRMAHAEGRGPLRLDDALWARVSGLAPRARMLLTIICVAGGPVARKVAQHALSAEGDEVERLVSGLRADHFVRASNLGADDAFEPYHDRIRETVQSRLSPAELRGWHARLALALETMGGGELEELYAHWQGAGDPLRAGGYAARAGDEAMAAFAFDRAARLYRAALSLLPRHAAERPSLLLRLGDAHNNGGRGRDAAEAYIAAAELYPDASSLELRRRAAENLLRSGYIDEGMQHLRAVLVAVGLDFPESLPATLAALLFRRAELRVRGLGFTERHPDKIAPAELRRVDVCWSAAKGLGMVDSLRGAYFQVRALLYALAAGDPYRISRSLSLEMGFVATQGPAARPRVDELIRAAQLTAERSRHPHALALVPSLSGCALFLEGRFREALPRLEEGLHRLRTRCVGVSWEIGSVLTFQTWTLWMSGEYRALVERVPGAIREAEERGDRYLATNLCSGFPNATWLVQDDPETAVARAASAIGPWSRGGSHLQHFHDVVARAHIDLYRGNGAAAYQYVTAGWKGLEESMSLRIHMVRVTTEHLRGAAALAAARTEGRPAPLLAVAVRAARKLEAERAPWVMPLAALLRAGVKAREGERGTAVTSLLEEAARGAEACGMAGHAMVARLALGRVRGAEGRELAEQAEADLRASGVKDPARFVGMLAPGFEG